jgi:YhcH/YjgK/YiaL family protein
MIYDKLERIKTYVGLSNNISTAIKFIEDIDLGVLQDGKTEIDGENVFALAFGYETKSLEMAKWEAHKKYIDIHITVSGKEKIGYAELENLEVVEKYNEETDCMFLKGEGQFLALDNEHFAMFYPGEGHKPAIFINECEQVRKVVIKILVYV